MYTETNIMDELSKGSKSALEELFHRHYNEIVVYAMSIIPDEMEAEEIAQQTFIKLWEKRGNAANIKSARSYLYRSAYNACMNILEHEKVKKKYQSETEYRLRTIDTDEFDDAGIPDFKEQLHVAIEELPPKTKDVFHLRYFEELSNDDIAEKLNITKRTVETHLYNSLKFLRNHFKHLLLIAVILHFFTF